MSIAEVVNVQISRDTRTIDQAGFGRALILGENPAALLTLYTDLASVAADFEVTDPEYLAAKSLFSQQLKPVDVLIGKRDANVAQVDIITVESLVNANYVLTLNGVEFTYTPGGTPASKTAVSTALRDAVNAGTEPVTAALSGTAPDETLSLTADNSGEPFTATVSSNMSRAASVEDQGVSSALDDILASGVLGDSWYALILCSRTNVDILAAAAWIEARRKIFIACSDEASMLTSASDDIASQLYARSYARTAIIYSGDADNFPEAAWLGVGLPKQPGSVTYSLKTLAGILYDDLNASVVAYLKAKKANYYVRYGGVSLTQNGNMAEGEWIDVIVGIDWIQARASENVFATMISNDKINFTDQGIDIVANPLDQILRQAVERNILASYTIDRPKASDFTSVEKQTRILTDLQFHGITAGAIHAVDITGDVHV